MQPVVSNTIGSNLAALQDRPRFQKKMGQTPYTQSRVSVLKTTMHKLMPHRNACGGAELPIALWKLTASRGRMGTAFGRID